MAKAPTLTTISSGYGSTTQLNGNSTAISASFENTLSLDGSTPNSMQADLDINGQDIINVSSIEADGMTLNGVAVTPTSVAATPAAAAITITDAGGYYTGANVEAALQEAFHAQDLPLSTGSSTVYALTPAETITVYTDELTFVFQVHTTSGTSPTLNVDGVGAANIKVYTSSNTLIALPLGGWQDGAIVTVKYDGTQFVAVSGVAWTGGATVPGVVKVLDEDTMASDHNTWPPSQQSTKAYVDVTRAKCFIQFNGTGTVATNSSDNVLSLVDNGTGDYTVNIDTDMGSANYTAVAHTSESLTALAGGIPDAIAIINRLAGSFEVNTADGTSSTDATLVLDDKALIDVVLFG